MVEGVTPGKHSSRHGLAGQGLPLRPQPLHHQRRCPRLADAGRAAALPARAVARDRVALPPVDPRATPTRSASGCCSRCSRARRRRSWSCPTGPAAYDDVGRACRWGEVLPELLGRPVDGRWEVAPGRPLVGRALRRARRRARTRAAAPPATDGAGGASHRARRVDAARAAADRGAVGRSRARHRPSGSRRRRRRLPGRGSAAGIPGSWADDEDAETDRRVRPRVLERRIQDHPGRVAIPFPDRYLTRSSYERVFLRLVSGGRLRHRRRAARAGGDARVVPRRVPRRRGRRAPAVHRRPARPRSRLGAGLEQLVDVAAASRRCARAARSAGSPSARRGRAAAGRTPRACSDRFAADISRWNSLP